MTANLTIHRLLDEAFTGVDLTSELQDLKEELRANLVARVEELEDAGVAPSEAARRAFDEVGDFRTLVDDAATGLTEHSAENEWKRHQVRARAGFVVRASVLPILAAAGLALAYFAGGGLMLGGAPVAAGLMLAYAILLGFVCADSLQQETSASYPMPRDRAIGYGVGVAAVNAGVGLITLCWVAAWPLWVWLVAGGALTVAGIGILAWLGATQTNRSKPWVRDITQTWPANGATQHTGNRFERDPNAAARFGIYTAVLWILAITVGVLLGIFVGWWWVALPAVGALALMLLLVTQMLLRSGRSDD